MDKNSFPHILIGSPTSKQKSYCDHDWIANIMKTNYPNYDVRLFDNTDDNGEYCQELNDWYKKNYGDNDKFLAIKSDTKFCKGLVQKVCKGHNDFRKYVLNNEYKFGFHCESDVFPAPHVLQELLLHKKAVVGSLYDRDSGRFRRKMIQVHVHRSHNNIFSKNFDPDDDAYFMDGTLKQVSHIGLGSILIRRDILERVPFRYVENMKIFPDSWWAEDLWRLKIKIYADTLLPIAEHRNQVWQTEVVTKENPVI
jgi:hypothetical protein